VLYYYAARFAYVLVLFIAALLLLSERQDARVS
jgi:hypothetical protein